jgi:hypothetical protein
MKFDKQTQLYALRKTHTQKKKEKEKDTRSIVIRFFLWFSKIYIQHKEPVIGDFCCRNR